MRLKLLLDELLGVDLLLVELSVDLLELDVSHPSVIVDASQDLLLEG